MSVLNWCILNGEAVGNMGFMERNRSRQCNTTGAYSLAVKVNFQREKKVRKKSKRKKKGSF